MKKLIIERTFTATADEVWDALTDPAVLQQWWAPTGMHCSYLEADVREGGRFRFCFTMDDGSANFWGRGEYQKINPTTYLSYYDSFTDAEGNDVPPSHYDMPGSDIVVTLVEIELTEDDSMTHLTLTAENPFDDAMTNDMTDGWNSMFDRLATVLEG